MERAVIGLAEQGVRSSIVRLPLIAHDTTDSAGFLPGLIALAKEKGFAGYPGDGANLWCAVHIRDVASVFRLALEKGPAGKYWHAIAEGGIPFREIAEAIGSRLDLPTVSVPEDVLMLPGYFGLLRIWSRGPSQRPAASRARPWAGNPRSPACSPIWTTAITSRPDLEDHAMTGALQYAVVGTGSVGTVLAQRFSDHHVPALLANTRGPETIDVTELSASITPVTLETPWMRRDHPGHSVPAGP